MKDPAGANSVSWVLAAAGEGRTVRNVSAVRPAGGLQSEPETKNMSVMFAEELGLTKGVRGCGK